MKGKREAPAPKSQKCGRLWGIVILGLIAAAALAVSVWYTQQRSQPRSDDPALDSSVSEPEADLSDESDAEVLPDGDDDSPQSTKTQDEDGRTEEMQGDVVTEAGSDDLAAENAKSILAAMTLDEKIYQLFIVTPEQLTGVSTVTQSGETTRKAIEKYPVGGIVYFAPNLISREQCTLMISNIQSYSKLGLFIAVDEEGGTVARLGNNPAMGTTAFPSMGEIGASEDPSKAYDVGYTIGTEIAELGFNVDFAPVADVNSNSDNPVIGTRAFSSDPETAAAMVEACVEGFKASGSLCTLKHFPGHGDTNTDSHYGEVETVKTLEELYECEFLPFEAGIETGASLVMVGHITAPNVIDEAVPATLSYEIVTGLLRNTLGFSGLIITDSMSMQAITDQYSSGEAAVKALQAGVDLILMPQSLSDAVSGIKTALSNGELSEERLDESVLRILETKISNGIIQPQ